MHFPHIIFIFKINLKNNMEKCLFVYNIKMSYTYTIFMVYIWKYLHVINKINIEIKEYYIKHLNQ